MVAPQVDADEAALIEWFRARGTQVCVAFSGGVDSALVLAAAVRALGAQRVLAVTAQSPALGVAERRHAVDFARRQRVRHDLVATNELGRPGYRTNGRDRCFHCKAELVDVLRAVDGGGRLVCTGTNADDAVDPFRPGVAAAAARGAATPLADCGLTKQRVRALAAHWALPVADKPAQACLASRIGYGQQVSAELLEAVDRAETALRRWYAITGRPLIHVRVRVLADRVRVEVDRAAIAFLPPPTRLARLVARAGIHRAGTEIAEFVSGGLNLLPDQRPARVAAPAQ